MFINDLRGSLNTNPSKQKDHVKYVRNYPSHDVTDKYTDNTNLNNISASY